MGILNTDMTAFTLISNGERSEYHNIAHRTIRKLEEVLLAKQLPGIILIDWLLIFHWYSYVCCWLSRHLVHWQLHPTIITTSCSIFFSIWPSSSSRAGADDSRVLLRVLAAQLLPAQISLHLSLVQPRQLDPDVLDQLGVTRGRPTWTAENIGRPPGTPFTRDMSFLALDAAVPCCWIRCSRMLLRAAQRRCAEHLYIMGMRAECWVDSSIHVWIKKVKLKAELGMQQSFRFATNENAITC